VNIAMNARIQAENVERASCGWGNATDHSHGRGLSCSVRTEKSETFVLTDCEVNSSDSFDLVEFFPQAFGLNREFDCFMLLPGSASSLLTDKP
jgi:hypothetical protein